MTTQSDALFNAYIVPILVKEGPGYTNDPNDSGGETKWGVTIARARAAGYNGAMADMTQAQAVEIYRLYYWTQPMFDQLSAVSGPVASICLDLGINMGQTWPGKYIQRALNVLDGTPGAALTPDGVAGAMTRAALATFLKKRGPDGLTVIIDMIRAQASVRYMELAETATKNEDYEYGWQLNRAFSIPA